MDDRQLAEFLISTVDPEKESSNTHANLERRKAIKLGALTGVAGIVGASGLGRLSNASSVSTKITGTLTHSFEDFLCALTEAKLIEPFNSVISNYVPRYDSVTHSQKVPSGYLGMIWESRIVVQQDHFLQMSVKIDGKEVLFDPDVVQARYERPLQFITATSFHPIRESFSITVTNKTSRPRYFSSMQMGGRMKIEQWDANVVPYLNAVRSRD
jgi:hypothetical protein